MNMASIGIFIFTVIYITVVNAGLVDVKCKTENMGQYGQQSLLDCAIETSQEATGAVFRTVSWKKEGIDEPLLLFHKGETIKQPGYSFAEPSWNNRNMNVSLHITNTTVEDQGVYTCTVMTDSGSDTSKTTLKVTAKYSKPTIISEPEKISQSTGGTLVCNSVGGYPKGQIRWFGELNEDWTGSSDMEVKETKSGLFELSSKLTLLRGSTYSKYTCAVFNTSGGKEDEATFEVPDGQDTSGHSGGEPGKPTVQVTTIVAASLVIGSLIVGLLGVILYKMRSRRDHREVRAFESDAEEGGGREVDKEYQDTLA
ncbi:leucine-rich repeats and immunoglobulin-like domains protein 3 [Sparus aurata]|uniref:leucine-rich repeats and immunoglobulin-like domains protein 3 n=1 Tax=Sparus aurata TaxID=8175 RepID=UPI0011C0ECFA|nr:leucine-rich repeats and immunoglobulin-like domains protein 3 [Sparus aurata]